MSIASELISLTLETCQQHSQPPGAWLPLPDNPGGGRFVRVTDSNLVASAVRAARGSLGRGCTPTTRLCRSSWRFAWPWNPGTFS